jgi:hypothetical protein
VCHSTYEYFFCTSHLSCIKDIRLYGIHQYYSHTNICDCDSFL